MYLIEEFLDKAPALIEHQPKLLKMTATLEEMLRKELSLDDVEKLMPMTETLPTLLRALRPGSLSIILTLFRASLTKLWKVAAGDEHVTLKQLDGFSKLLHEAATIWPQDAELQEWVIGAGVMLEKCGEESMAAEITSGLHDILKVSMREL